MSLLARSLTPGSAASKIPFSLLSLAICDALGAPAEFRYRGTFPHIDTLQPPTHFSLPAGSWTDDTSMALCLAQSLINNPAAPSVKDQAAQYISWYKTGFLSSAGFCFDIGNATQMALSIWMDMGAEAGVPTVMAKIEKSLGGERSCGNGSLMRTLPIALVYWKTPARAEELARLASKVTHPHPRCQDACALYVSLVAMVLRAADEGRAMVKQEIVDAVKAWNGYTDAVLRQALVDVDWASKKDAEVSTSGYVLDSLEAALWALANTETLEEGAIKLVNFGDDADTVAAIYGGLAGAWYGKELVQGGFEDGKFGEWREGIVQRDVVEGFGRKLVEASSQVS